MKMDLMTLFMMPFIYFVGKLKKKAHAEKGECG